MRHGDIVGRFRPTHSTKPALDWTFQKDVDYPFVSSAFRSFEKIHASSNAPDLEFLTWRNAILLPNSGRQDDAPVS
jgi:hypothetical protein